MFTKLFDSSLLLQLFLIGRCNCVIDHILDDHWGGWDGGSEGLVGRS